MKRQGTGRVLTFAVTGALLGGVGIGGCSKHRGPYVNTQPEEQPSVNPGPEEAGEPVPEPEEPTDTVNEGPVEEPEPEPPSTNVTKQPG